ncbi:MAG: sulfatase, partial [Clostridia bacterium]|nr:sulfatase [Clostridia bacterium]
HCDVLPTLRDFLGQRIPTSPEDKLPGESFLAELTEGRGPVERKICILDEYGPVRMIRSRRYKYVHEGIHGGHQLYDLLLDPEEKINRFTDPAYAEIRDGLAEELEKAFREYTLAPFDGAKTAPTGSGQLGPIRNEGDNVFHPQILYFRDVKHGI